MLHAVNDFDQSIVLFLNQFAARSAVFDEVMYDLADASILQGGLFMAYFWWCWFREDGGGAAVGERRQQIIIAITGAIVAVVVSRILQVTLPFHQRPLHAPELHFVVPLGVNPQTLNMWNSLPSDHAAIYFALATAVWYQSRALGYAAMLWSLVLALLPRVYLGYHYPSDIIAGAVCGAVLMALVWHLTPRGQTLGRIIAWERSHRLAFYAVAFLVTYELATLFFDLRHLARDGYDIARAALGLHPRTQLALTP